MPRVIIAPAAAADVRRIWRHIAQDSASAADRMIDKIHSRYRHLTTAELGEERNDIAEGVRVTIVEPYLIFFRSTKDRIRILRVIHGTRLMPDTYFE